MKLEAGFYKVKKKGFGGKFHYLTIFYKGKEKFFRIDNLPEMKCDRGSLPFDDIEHITRLKRPLNIAKVMLHIEWTDSAGDDFHINFRDIQMFRALFELYPELGETCGANRRKPKVLSDHNSK